MHSLYGFSVNVQTITPFGEGSIRRAAELLARQLEAEGLFDQSRKRALPYPPRRIGLVTSAQSAAYADFIKILKARWGGLDIDLIDVQVQGEAAPAQIIAAIDRFNRMADPPEVLVLIRGGGSADDLAAFSHEQVTRAVAGSRVPVLAAIGHEIDTSLAELAADLRASTPSNAAELLVPDKQVVLQDLQVAADRLRTLTLDQLHEARLQNVSVGDSMYAAVLYIMADRRARLETARELLDVLSPRAAMRRGYAILRNEAGQATQTAAPGDIVRIELLRDELTAQVTHIRKRP
jgi:exodeoxyribonuclease VII large subunit